MKIYINEEKKLIQSLLRLSRESEEALFRLIEIKEQKQTLPTIEELNLPFRAKNRLKSENIRTIAELTNCQETDLLKIPGIGKKTLDEITYALAEKELTLKPNDKIK